MVLLLLWWLLVSFRFVSALRIRPFGGVVAVVLAVVVGGGGGGVAVVVARFLTVI